MTIIIIIFCISIILIELKLIRIFCELKSKLDNNTKITLKSHNAIAIMIYQNKPNDRNKIQLQLIAAELNKFLGGKDKSIDFNGNLMV